MKLNQLPIKRTLITLALFAFNVCNLVAETKHGNHHYKSSSLEKIIHQSELVIEGKVLEKKSFWDADHSRIYTANKVLVGKILKGSASYSEVTVLTEGGIVGNKMMTSSSGLELTVHTTGIFAMKPTGIQLSGYNNSSEVFYYTVMGREGFFQSSENDQNLMENIKTITGSTPVTKNTFSTYTNHHNTSGSRMAASISSVVNSDNPALGNKAIAGAFDEITITGTGFGSIAGSIRFPNVDAGSAGTVLCPTQLINSWTDTEIKVYVPEQAGTGNFEIYNSSSTFIGSAEIIVTYNVTNTVFSGTNYIPDMIDNNGSGGYTWTFNNYFYTFNDGVKRFAEAMELWSASTGVNWDTSATQTPVACNSNGDGVNVVTFNDDTIGCSLAAPYASTYSYYSACLSGGKYYWELSNVDIVFNMNANWYFGADPNLIGASQVDFMTIALHELGHAHQIRHSSLSEDLMYFNYTEGTTNRNLDVNAIKSGLLIMSRNSDNELSHAGSTGGSTVANPCGSSPMTPLEITNPLPNNMVYGRVVKDDNCSMDGGEAGLSRRIIYETQGDYYTITNSDGYYELQTDAGTYHVKQLISEPSALISPICPAQPDYHVITFDSTGLDTNGIDFHNNTADCPYLTVDVSSNRRRFCAKSYTYITYCNEGFADASNVKVTVELPEYVEFISADYSYTLDSDGNYVFDIGSLSKDNCGKITIIDSVSCEDSIVGLVQCTKAWITPSNASCLSLDSAWDKSNLEITSRCEANNAVYFTVKNTGTGNMSTVEYARMYANGMLIYINQVQLNSGDSIVFLMYNTTGATLRLEADQTDGHPTEITTYVDMTGCGTEATSYGYVEQLPQYDESVEVEQDCMPIINSYDPNDKQVYPSGITSERYVQPGTWLEYKIRFQNTGTDTAYQVVITDTLSANLDISTIQWGTSSHDYTIGVSGQGQPVLTFTFDNINLPDSATNELESQGFVKFKIAPLSTLSNGTKIHNSANIYFDVNAPITTNDAWVTIYDTTISGPSVTVTVVNNSNDGINEHTFIQPSVVPNPFSGMVKLMLPKELDTEYITVKMKDMTGRVVNVTQTGSSQSNQINMDGSNLKKGIYVIEVYENNRIIGRSKVVKR